ncbi:MAG: aldolase [Chloroflexi bacterium]|nr:aldolase [Chloroflexota bacterium]
MFLERFQQVGADLFQQRLAGAHTGNMSLRLGERIIITRRSAALAHLTEQDLVETGVDRNDRATPAATSELAVHRAIYRETEAQAVIHAHPAHAIALSLAYDEIVPVDAEGAHYFERVPVVGSSVAAVSRDWAEEIAQASRTNKIVLVRGHGCFATGQLLEECHQWVSALEESCRVLWMLACIGQTPTSPRRRTPVYRRPFR